MNGKVAVVTGGASGIGEGIANRFVEEGAEVIIGDLDAAAGERVAKSIGATFVECDVTRESELAALVGEATSQHGRLDCFVGNAGIGGVTGDITDLDEEGFDHTVAVLLKAVAFGMKHACRAMQESGGGSIVSTASVAGLVAGLSPNVYAACKAGVMSLTRTVAMEQGPHGIRVNAIAPGAIDTPIFTRSFAVEGPEADEVMRLIRAGTEATTALGRIGVPADIAAAAAWLASDDSSYVTGQVIVVDGGLTAGRLTLRTLIP